MKWRACCYVFYKREDSKFSEHYCISNIYYYIKHLGFHCQEFTALVHIVRLRSVSRVRKSAVNFLQLYCGGKAICFRLLFLVFFPSIRINIF